MKKFLFTLFALLVTCTAYAAGAKGYMYMPDTVLTADQLGKNVKMPVYVVLDNEYMNGFQCKFAYPDKIQGRTVSGNSSVLVIKDAILDSQGHTALDLYDPEDEDDPDNPVGPNYAQITFSGNATNCLGIGPAAQGYWDPQGDGTYETYGSVKLGPNGKLLLFYVTIRPAADFTDGYITMRWMWSGGADARNGQGSISTGDPTVDDGFTTLMVHVTVKQDNPAPAAEITNEGNVVTAAVPNDTENHNVELYIVTTDEDGNEVLTKVDNPYTVTQTFEAQVINFKAKTLANDDETEDTWSDVTPITIPAKADAQAPKPTFEIVDGKLYAVSAEGLEVVLKLDGEVVPNGYLLPTENTSFTDDIVLNFTAYAVADGVNYNVNSDDATYKFELPHQNDKQAPKPTFEIVDGKLYAVSAEGLEVVLKLNGTEVPNGYLLPTENTSYTDPLVLNFTAYAKADGETYNIDSDEASYPFSIPALTKKDAKKPTVVGQKREGSKTLFDIIITPDPATDGTLEYTAERVAGAKADPQTLTYTREAEDYDVHVTAYTTEGPTYKESAKVDTVITVPKLDQVAKPKIDYVVNGDKITITASTTDGADVVLVGPDGTEYSNGTATVTFDPSQGYLETWTATASAQDMLDNETTKVIEISALPKTEDPTIDVSFGQAGDNTIAYVTFKNNDEKPATIWYSTDGGETWNKYDPAVPVTFTATDTNQEITVLAYAEAEDKLPSDEVERTFELNNTATSVNELTNGKAVAGVRYFNMAGQEMQEANGITIVVTTYTDGTTSAVKVIK